ncbi:hypothetical protein [Vulcanisaeta distributa]|uniref:hypothetical protein n=1 Tax=Vulcanisaeta distributa TaxID=164451 RepID=UPI000AF4F2FC|nr:hypothetical protein [Vulcanisaeta distributa]
MILGTAYVLGKPLFTFDEELRRRAKRVGVEVLGGGLVRDVVLLMLLALLDFCMRFVRGVHV